MIARITVLTVVMLSLAFCGEALSGERVSVQTTNGRSFCGCVHAGSNHLVLRIESHGAATRIVRSIHWSQIRSVRIESVGAVLATDEARSEVEALTAPASKFRNLKPADAEYKSYAQQSLELLR
jgi:hypothetical protein